VGHAAPRAYDGARQSVGPARLRSRREERSFTATLRQLYGSVVGLPNAGNVTVVLTAQ
jgi:hypothetical protein